MKLILGNHWTVAPNNEWEVLKEENQDMTKPLQWEDNTVDILFTEHCQEHITLIENIFFFKETLRVLKDGGVLRIAMPCIDKMIKMGTDELSKHYADVQTAHYYPNEDAALKELGLEGVREEPIAFMMDSLFKGHHHKFLWTSELCKKVLDKIGFSEVHIQEPGETNFNKEDCLERVARGVDVNYLKEHFGLDKFDCETLVIEAKK